MSNFKGIILAGGSGSRLFPITRATSKQLLPIYDKPLIFYSLSVLMKANVREILIITTPKDKDFFERLLGDGSDFGIMISYATQKHPNGIAESLIIGRSFIGKSNFFLILGDNIFYHPNLSEFLSKASSKNEGATIFGHSVNDPSRFGVIEFSDSGEIRDIKEKPLHPKSDIAVTGLYIYDNIALKYVAELKPSNRGELEITDLNKIFLELNLLNVCILQKDSIWMDTGTNDALLDASIFVKKMQEVSNIQIGCLEEVALNKGWISIEKFKKLIKRNEKSVYGNYLKKCLEEKLSGS